MEKIKISRDQYEVLQFMAEVYGGVGYGKMYDADGPVCAYGLADEGGLIPPRYAEGGDEDKGLYLASSNRELPFSYMQSDDAVDAAARRLGLTETFMSGTYVPTGTRVPFEEWAKEMQFDVVDG